LYIILIRYYYLKCLSRPLFSRVSSQAVYCLIHSKNFSPFPAHLAAFWLRAVPFMYNLLLTYPLSSPNSFSIYSSKSGCKGKYFNCPFAILINK